MNPITECNRCSDCAIRLGFGFTQPDVLICTVRGDEVGPDDGCTMGTPGEPVQAVEACEVDVSGRVGYGAEALDWWPRREGSARRSGAPRTTRGPTETATSRRE